MDGFKNSTKTQYFKGGSAHEAKGAAKVAKVMGEFKSGKLHSGSKNGPEVTNRKQATAIAMSEARKAGAKMPMRKNEGGSVEADDALMARMTSRELAMGRAGIAAARARLAKEPASGPAKKLPPKAVPVAPKRPLIEVKKGYGPASSLSIKLKNGGPVKKAVGGPAMANPATTPPKPAPSALLASARSISPQDYQKAQAARAAAATPAAKAAARANATASAAKAAAAKTAANNAASNAAALKQKYAAQQAARDANKNSFTAKQAEINKMKASNAAKMAEGNKMREARAAQQATIQANTVKLAQQKATNDAMAAATRQKMTEFNQRQTALGQPTIPVKKAAGGLAAMPKGKC